MNKPTLVERFADNGEHSHWELVNEQGKVIWGKQKEQEEERFDITLSKLCAENDINPVAPAVYFLKDYAGGTDEYVRIDIVYQAMAKISNSDRLLPDKMNLSKLAEKQLIEIQYAFGCTEEDAVSYALESLHAFETITDDQIYNWLHTKHPEQLEVWQQVNNEDRILLENN